MVVIADGVAATLKRIDISKFTILSDRGVSYLLEICGELVAFSAAQCHHLTDLALVGLAEASTSRREQQDGSKITHLNLSGTQLQSTALEWIASVCPSLICLNLSHCSQLQDIAVCRLWDACTSLVNVDLSHCTRLTDSAFRHSQSIASLKSLNIRGCTSVNDEALRSIASLCPLLEVLCLVAISGITDQGVLHLTQGCKLLRTIDMAGKRRVSNIGIAMHRNPPID